MRWTKPALAAALACTLALPAAAQQAAPDKTVNLRISLWVPPTHPLVQSVRDWVADMTRESGGSITATVFPAEQLGKAFDHYDMARDGIADVAYVSPGYQPGRFPIVNAPQLPFMTANAKGGSAAVDEWYAPLAAKEMGDTHFCMAFIADPGTLHSKTKVVGPEDVSGLKVRPAQETVAQMITTLGGTNVQSSIGEARDLLSRGVAGAITDFWNSQFLFGINDVTKFHIDFPLYTSAYVLPFNKAAYDGMSASAEGRRGPPLHARMGREARHALGRLRACRAGADRQGAGPHRGGADAGAARSLEGSRWHPWSPPGRRACARPGSDPAPILADLKARLAAHGAAY